VTTRRATRAARLRATAIALLGVAAVLAGGCATASSNVTSSIHGWLSPTTTSSAAATTSTTASPCDPTKSVRPTGALQPPGAMPPNTYMAAIQRRGYLIVGVDQTTLFFGYRNPQTGVIDGFDIALAREVARAIFGDPSKIVPRALTTSERLLAVEHGQVDLVASQVTATCARRADVDLSTIYYEAHQKVLVRKGGAITRVSDLKGKKVCATTGSTSLVQIEQIVPGVIPYPVAVRTDCLVALQEGWVDAITSDDTILLGFEHQDPSNTTILPPELAPEPYALATSKAHPEFGRFVNAVLDRLRATGRLEQLYQQYLNQPDVGFRPPAAPPAAAYQD
jgi:polar amino acid transport system substrate-binding protein